MPTGLIRRGARYSIRRRVPVDLVAHYRKPELTKALGTADPKVARQRLPLKWSALDKEFEAVRARLATTAPSQRTDAAPTKVPDAAAKASNRAPMSEAEWDYIQENEKFWAEQDAKEEFERDEAEAEERRLLAIAEGVADGLTLEQRAFRNLLRDKDYFRQVAEEQLAIARSELKRAQAQLKAVQAEQPAAPSGLEPIRAAALTPLDVIVDKWAAERKVSAKGVEAHRAVARWFIERAGDLSVEKITKRDVLTFKDKMLEEGATPANVKVKLTRLRTLLNYAASNDFIQENPAKSVTVVVPDAERNKRKPFDLQSLTAIFNSPIYTQDERPKEGRGEAAYWLPLLGLYTGARLEELGQLRPSDVREETYPDADETERTAWFIHLVEDDEDDLKLKNAGSERIIPVHPSLEQQGFIRFVRDAQDGGRSRLFPELRPDKWGHLTAKWGEWFGDYKRNVIGITDGRLVFHSFRHTFKRYARHVKMVEGVQRQIMGHSGKDAADDYGDGYTHHQLVEGMREFKVPGFKLPPLPPAFR
jgi:integrase